MAMPEYTPAPAPSKAEFDSLASDVSTLNGKMTWQTGESTTDKTATKNVPSTANEAIVEIQYRTNMLFTFTFNKLQLATTTRKYYDQGIRFASSGAACRLDVLNFAIKVDTLYIDGGTEDFKMQIYYR